MHVSEERKERVKADGASDNGACDAAEEKKGHHW